MWTDLDLTGTRWIAPSSTSSSNIWTESECYSFFNRIPTATAVGPLNLSIPSRLRNHFLSVPLLTSLRFSLPRQGSVLWRIVPWLHLSQILAVNPSMPASPSLSIFWFTVSLSLFIHSLSLSLSRCLTGGHWTKLITDERRFVEVKERDHSDISLPFISSVHLLYFHFAYLLLSCDTLCVPTHILFALHLSTVPPVPLSPPVCSVLFMYFFLNRWYFILNGKKINKAMI